MKGTGYLLQATLISLWWLGLSISDHFFNAFQFPEIGSKAFNSFFVPDLMVVAILSVVRAYISKRELEFIILGGFAYGTFYCVNASILTQGGYLATTVMALGFMYNLFLVFQGQVFRESESKSTLINGLKTLIQIICVWSITLVLFPWLIMDSFGENLNPQVGTTYVLGLTLFILFGFLGLFSAYSIVKVGNGTPLPIDQTSELVISGPYRYVRNPMAIAGVGQSISVSIAFSSLSVLTYALLGAALWHIVVRPLEENNMRMRFGSDFDEYRKKVSCWIPKLNNSSK